MFNEYDTADICMWSKNKQILVELETKDKTNRANTWMLPPLLIKTNWTKLTVNWHRWQIAVTFPHRVLHRKKQRRCRNK